MGALIIGEMLASFNGTTHRMASGAESYYTLDGAHRRLVLEKRISRASRRTPGFGQSVAVASKRLAGTLEWLMTNLPASAPLLLWLTPALLALLLYGLGQGFVKMWIAEVPPARFCLYFAVARALVMGCYFFTNPHTPVFAAEGRQVLAIGVLAYLLDGTGWIMYFQSIIAGPITIVGTLSAAYPAVTIVFAHWFLGETLSSLQYVAVVLVIGGCIGLAYQPADAANKVTGRAWIPLAFSALMLWGAAQTIVKYDYSLGATDVNMSLYSVIGALMTLGVYGLWKGRAGKHSFIEWLRSFLPMGMMASGDLGVLVASRYGEISIVTPLTGAYPLVTLAFAALVLRERIILLQWCCIVAILAGIYFCAS
jgi:drug/metabolite transporter (DMT)-like permease